jgi:beta-galactosidase
VAYKDGKTWADDVEKTASEPAGLEPLLDRDTIAADGRDQAFVTVSVLDKDGLTCPRQ